MAGRVGNKTWLRQQLQKALQWDADAAEAVCEAVAAAGSPEEVDALVEAYMGGNPAARKLVEQFKGTTGASAAATAAAPPGMQMLQRGGGGSGSAASSRHGGGTGTATGSTSRAPPQSMELAPPAEKPKVRQLQAAWRVVCACTPLCTPQCCYCTPRLRQRHLPACCALPPFSEVYSVLRPCLPHCQLYMGPNVRVATAAPKPRKARGGAAAGEPAAGEAASSSSKALAKPVINCLRCGKIYDCRSMSDGAKRFLGAARESGSFCSSLWVNSWVVPAQAGGQCSAQPGRAAPAAARPESRSTGSHLIFWSLVRPLRLWRPVQLLRQRSLATVRRRQHQCRRGSRRR